MIGTKKLQLGKNLRFVVLAKKTQTNAKRFIPFCFTKNG